MKTVTGSLRKMKAALAEPIEYQMVLSEQRIALNPLIGSQIKLEHTGKIYCIQCGRDTKKSFQQGYCFPCYRRLQECNMCLIHPERCLVEEGQCPEDDWAHAQCHAQQIVYLANTSGLKVGITRATNVPTRWIDQGATQALPIFQAGNRYQTGLIEVALKKYVNDKTDWRAMLRNHSEPMDLLARRDELLTQAAAELDAICQKYPDSIASIDDANVQTLQYPIHDYPEKIRSQSLDKAPLIEGVLQGIKGQYLYLDDFVLNVRKFGGYEIVFSFEG